MDRAGFLSASTVAVASFEWTGLPAKVADAVAWLVTEPASTSAWVTAYSAVQVSAAPGSRVDVDGQLTAVRSSCTVKGPERVTFAVLFSVYVYVTTWPTWSYVAGDALFVSANSGSWAASAVAL